MKSVSVAATSLCFAASLKRRSGSNEWKSLGAAATPTIRPLAWRLELLWLEVELWRINVDWARQAVYPLKGAICHILFTWKCVTHAVQSVLDGVEVFFSPLQLFNTMFSTLSQKSCFYFSFYLIQFSLPPIGALFLQFRESWNLFVKEKSNFPNQKKTTTKHKSLFIFAILEEFLQQGPNLLHYLMNNLNKMNKSTCYYSKMLFLKMYFSRR